MLSEIHAKTKNSELKTVLLSIWNDLPQKLIDKAILLFRKRLRSCVAAAGGHFEHSVETELTFITETFELLAKNLVQFDSL